MAQPTTISAILDEIVNREQGYVNHPADAGGPTKYGVTLNTLRRERNNPKLTINDLKKITPAQAKEIYFGTYVAPFVTAGVRDQRLMSLLADSAVHHGHTRAVRFLQSAAGVTPDGLLGPETIQALKAQRPRELYNRVFQQRKQLIENLGKDPAQQVFLEGWRNRLSQFEPK